MGFEKGNSFGARSKRGKAKVNEDLKGFLEVLTIEALQSIDVAKLSNSDKIKFVSTGLNYILPKLQNTQIEAEVNTNNLAWLESYTDEELNKILKHTLNEK